MTASLPLLCFFFATTIWSHRAKWIDNYLTHARKKRSVLLEWICMPGQTLFIFFAVHGWFNGISSLHSYQLPLKTFLFSANLIMLVVCLSNRWRSFLHSAVSLSMFNFFIKLSLIRLFRLLSSNWPLRWWQLISFTCWLSFHNLRVNIWF